MSKLFDIEMPTSLESKEFYENPLDRQRREWAAASGDWAFAVLQFLQGEREAEVTTQEILTTKLYAHSSPREKASLNFVSAQATPAEITPSDTAILIERDNFLLDYAETRMLGHMDWVKQLADVPAQIARTQVLDATLFPKLFPSPRIFRWIWKS